MTTVDASVTLDAIEQRFRCAHETATQVFGCLFVSEMSVDDRLQWVNRQLDLHGAETISALPWGEGEQYARYLNNGDAYAPTLLWDIEQDTILLTSWGDWVEQGELEGRFTLA